jgi:hypothetical protein
MSLLHKLSQAPIQWYAATIVTMASWTLSWVVGKSCEFVVVFGTDQNGTIVDDASLNRGTQGGQLRPGDSCQAWGTYDDLELSSKVVATRIAASLTIVLGALILAWLLLWPCLCCCCCQRRRLLLSRIGALLALICAGFQAMTHLIVKSDLCEESNFTTTADDGTTELLWNTCDKSTTAYNITFGTITMWVLACILICCIPYGDTIDEVYGDCGQKAVDKDKGEEEDTEHKPPP